MMTAAWKSNSAGGGAGRSPLWRLGTVLLVLVGGACDGLLKNDQLPPEVSDPAVTQTPQGALAVYNGALVQLRDAYGTAEWVGASSLTGAGAPFVGITGMLSDELHSTKTGSSVPELEDVRILPEADPDPTGTSYAKTFSRLQRTRGQAGQAIDLLRLYRPSEPALVGHMYALEGYAEVFLAELFCSGIPLSTLDEDGGYTYRPGSSTEEVLTHAVALFDSALAYANDSVAFVHLAQVGKARALLGLGQYAAAAAAVGAVPDAYHYDVGYVAMSGVVGRNFTRLSSETSTVWDLTVADREGGTGLDYVSSGDPRTRVTQRGTITGGGPIWHPDKYLVNGVADGSGPIVLASGVEARLIEAEAALQASDAGTWLAKLNTLRTDGTFEVVDSQAVTDTTIDLTATPPDTTIDTTGWTYDTLWHAGTGGVAGLRPLDDPGTVDGRVDLLFRERAFWLFLTGHRQGDLRRLIRQYGRVADEIYPTGPYPNPVYSSYGGDITAPIPAAEGVVNPQFTGCASRGA